MRQPMPGNIVCAGRWLAIVAGWGAMDADWHRAGRHPKGRLRLQERRDNLRDLAQTGGRCHRNPVR